MEFANRNNYEHKVYNHEHKVYNFAFRMKNAKGFVKQKKIFRTGVVLLENDYYDSKTNRRGIVATLFRDPRWNVYYDLGGRTHDEDSITSGINHVQINSLNTLVINNRNLIKTTDKHNNKYYIQYKDHKFRSFMTYFFSINMRIDDIYNNNMKIMQENNQFCQSVGIKRFFISDIENCLKNKIYNEYKDVQCMSTDGSISHIAGTTLNSIEMMLEHNRCYKFMDNIIDNPINHIISKFKDSQLSELSELSEVNNNENDNKSEINETTETRTWNESVQSQKNTENPSFYGTTSLILN